MYNLKSLSFKAKKQIYVWACIGIFCISSGYAIASITHNKSKKSNNSLPSNSPIVSPNNDASILANVSDITPIPSSDVNPTPNPTQVSTSKPVTTTKKPAQQKTANPGDIANIMTAVPANNISNYKYRKINYTISSLTSPDLNANIFKNNESVQFKVSDTDLKSCSWNFGDGSSSDQCIITHTYNVNSDVRLVQIKLNIVTNNNEVYSDDHIYLRILTSDKINLTYEGGRPGFLEYNCNDRNDSISMKIIPTDNLIDVEYKYEWELRYGLSDTLVLSGTSNPAVIEPCKVLDSLGINSGLLKLRFTSITNKYGQHATGDSLNISTTK